MKIRKTPPRTLEGLEIWLQRQGRECRHTVEEDLKSLPDDPEARRSRLKEWWYHLEKGRPLPEIGEIIRQSEMVKYRQAREEAERQAAIRRSLTTNRKRITQYRKPDSEWRPHRGPKKPLPWPWPR